mmetsp:Transcript_70681/g.111920  ORF Transcript_70681/g.111920 Transcript_70681/m.111920 type:complete len:213 (-) Transcript_70681:619-1257(-)
MRLLGHRAAIAIKLPVPGTNSVKVFHIQLAIPPAPPWPILASKGSLPISPVCNWQAINLNGTVPWECSLSKAHLLSRKQLVVLKDDLPAHVIEESSQRWNLFCPGGKVAVGAIDHSHLTRCSWSASNILIQIHLSRHGRSMKDNVARSFEAVVVSFFNGTTKSICSFGHRHLETLNLLAVSDGAFVGEGNMGWIQQVLYHQGMIDWQVYTHQ